MSPRRARRGGRWSGCLVVLMVLLAPASSAWAAACVACPHSGLPTSRDLRFGLFPGELVTDVSVAATWGGRDPVAGEAARPRERGLWFENRWVALLGFTHSLGLELELPLQLAFTSASGTPTSGAGETVHASRSGPGDTWLSLRFARPVGAWTLLVTAGLSLPTGGVVSPTASDASLATWAERATSSGSGSWDPLVKLALTRRWGPLELVAVGQGRVQSPGAERDRWSASRVFGSVGLAQGPGHRWRYGLSVDVLHPGAGDRTGLEGGSPSVPLIQLLTSGFVQLRVNTWSARLSAHLPLTQWGAVGGQGATGWVRPLWIQLGLVTAFDVGV